jgi:CBS domain-containing protein
MVREDYVRVRNDDSLVEVMRKLLECVRSGNGCLCALVFDGCNLLGAVSIWDTIRFMQAILKQSGLEKEEGEGGFEELFHLACKLGAATRVTEIMDSEYTVLAPDMSIPAVMDKFVKKGRSYAVVREGARTLGVIMIQDVFAELAEAVRSRL